jgi:diguanylate cyclase (GGDEF)-like protein
MDNLIQSASPATTLEERVRLHQAQLFLDHSRGNMPSMIAAALLTAMVLYFGGATKVAILLWFIAILAAALLVTLYSNHLVQIKLTSENRSRLLGRRIALGTLVILLSGISGFLLPPTTPLYIYTFLFMILSGVVTVAALAFSMMPSYYLAMSATAMVPLTLLFLWHYLLRDESLLLLLVALVITWQVAVMKKALLVSRSVIHGITLNEQLQQEIAKHEAARESIRHMALHDTLTELGNRRHFDATLYRTLQSAQRSQRKFALLVIDLDDFKPVNDQYGHPAGDLLLQTVANRLRQQIRSADFVARTGGDEFAIILDNVHHTADLETVLSKLRVAITTPIPFHDHLLKVGASIGTAIYPDDATDVEALLLCADSRMYANKRLKPSIR